MDNANKLDNNIKHTAESFSENFSDRFNFDFSCESLVSVNELIEEVMDYYVDEDTQYNIMTMAGSYVFEVAKRNLGGKYYWLQSEQ